MSLIKAVGLHEFVAMYTNHLLTNARPLRSKHLSYCAGVLIVPLLVLLTYELTSQRVPTLHQKWQICCCVCCIYVYSPFSELQYVVGDNQNSSDSAKLSFCGCVPAYDASVRNRGRSYARKAPQGNRQCKCSIK